MRPSEQCCAQKPSPKRRSVKFYNKVDQELVTDFFFYMYSTRGLQYKAATEMNFFFIFIGCKKLSEVDENLKA